MQHNMTMLCYFAVCTVQQEQIVCIFCARNYGEACAIRKAIRNVADR
jgi:hypothetical protein